jgi:hypothetical protein
VLDCDIFVYSASDPGAAEVINSKPFTDKIFIVKSLAGVWPLNSVPRILIVSPGK